MSNPALPLKFGACKVKFAAFDLSVSRLTSHASLMFPAQVNVGYIVQGGGVNMIVLNLLDGRHLKGLK